MKINKVADEKVAPNWAFGSNSLDEFEKNKAILKTEVERINIAKDVTDDVLAKECEAIEKCASSGKIYHYNSKWTEKHIEHLKEFAAACGMDSSKVKGVDPTPLIQDMDEIEKQASDARVIKTASAQNSKLVLSDPFHLAEHADTSHMDKEDWQKVKKQSNMKEVPSMVSGSVKPLRGGEDYLKNTDVTVAKNQNSIANPDAIKQFVESEKIDTGARLKAEKQAREDAKKVAHAEWQKNLVDAMDKKDIVPKGNVFPTEVMNAQSGLNSPSSQMGVYAKFDPKNIPEKTAGEKIKDSREEWNRSIQRPDKVKTEFKMDKASTRSISEVFGEELKKRVK